MLLLEFRYKADNAVAMFPLRLFGIVCKVVMSDRLKILRTNDLSLTTGAAMTLSV